MEFPLSLSLSLSRYLCRNKEGEAGNMWGGAKAVEEKYDHVLRIRSIFYIILLTAFPLSLSLSLPPSLNASVWEEGGRGGGCVGLR